MAHCKQDTSVVFACPVLQQQRRDVRGTDVPGEPERHSQAGQVHPLLAGEEQCGGQSLFIEG